MQGHVLEGELVSGRPLAKSRIAITRLVVSGLIRGGLSIATVIDCVIKAYKDHLFVQSSHFINSISHQMVKKTELSQD